MKRTIYGILLIFGMLAIASCGSREWAGTLDEVEFVIQERPDSALQRLRTLDPAQFGTKSQRARYSLLHAMALDKNYIDTTDVSVVMPAVEYYRKHGTADQKMKAWYYLGRIHYNRNDLNAAAIAFSLSEKSLPDAKDLQAKGLLYMALASVYNKARDWVKEEDYVRKGIQVFTEAGDTKHLNLTHGRLAMAMLNNEKNDEADSLFTISLERCAEDSLAMALYLRNYAKFKVFKADMDPAGAIALLDRRRDEYKQPFSIDDYCVYAYASLLVGDVQTCNQIEKSLMELTGERKKHVLFWLEYMEKYRGNYQTALEYCHQVFRHNMDLAKGLISNSVAQALQDYYKIEAETVKRESQLTSLRISLVATALFILLLITFWCIKRKRDRRQAETERLLRMTEDANRILRQDFDRERHDLQGQMEETLESLRKTFAEVYKKKFSTIGELCNAWLFSKDRKDKAEYISHKVEEMIVHISSEDKLHRKFENQINRDLDDIVKHLKADLNIDDLNESRFICYCIVGFEPGMIATLLGLTLSNVYTKKSRLKEKIRGLDSPYKEAYLRML